MTRLCYVCAGPTDSPTGLCAACLGKAWEDHVRDTLGPIPPENVESWDHKPDEIWYWSSEGCWKLADRDPRGHADFAGWVRPPDAVVHTTAPTWEDLTRDLVAIIADLVEENDGLRADKGLLERTVAELMNPKRALAEIVALARN